MVEAVKQTIHISVFPWNNSFIKQTFSNYVIQQHLLIYSLFYFILSFPFIKINSTIYTSFGMCSNMSHLNLKKEGEPENEHTFETHSFKAIRGDDVTIDGGAYKIPRHFYTKLTCNITSVPYLYYISARYIGPLRLLSK